MFFKEFFCAILKNNFGPTTLLFRLGKTSHLFLIKQSSHGYRVSRPIRTILQTLSNIFEKKFNSVRGETNLSNNEFTDFLFIFEVDWRLLGIVGP